ncbi:MAG: Stp1/IreP family PP2C-type Ser/Thr phosphatase [Ardenticatenaceae bacterium]
MATIRLEASGDKHVGMVREVNQDEFFVRVMDSSDAQPIGLFVVADGMGGHAGGDIASRVSVQTIIKKFDSLFTPHDPLQTVKFDTVRLEAEMSGKPAPTRILGATKIRKMIREAVQEANQVVLNTARHKPLEAGDAGATVTLAVVQGSKAYIGNLGDSRTYLYRNGDLKPITEDHSVVGSLLKAGFIEPEEVYSHPQRNIVLRALGNREEPKVDIFEKELRPGDRLLLCSDGLWEMVRDPQMAKIIKNARNPQSACRKLIQTANANGGKDNIGVVVVWVQ